MRLHHLSVTAFGPFVDTAEVDFDALSDAGLFLLSGATGSGKSSVLDAVCFALYGAVPGDRQHAGRLRADQAPATLSPSVTLELTLSDRRFRVVRSPAWRRPKKRGTGTTPEQARVTVSERAGSGWVHLTSRLDEAGDLLTGLLGMNVEQFCQVVLLPQGQFQAFLRARPDERQRLLARLFRTGRFERVETWLREHRLSLRRACDAHAQVVADLVSRVSEAAGSPVPEALAEPTVAADDGTLAAWASQTRGHAAARRTTAGEAWRAATETETAAREAFEAARSVAASRARVVAAAEALERLRLEAAGHAADAVRVELARRAGALRPLVRLTAERRLVLTELGSASAESHTELERAGLDADDLSAELARITRALAELSALLPAERRLAELRHQEADAGRLLDRLDDEVGVVGAETRVLSARVGELESGIRQSAVAANDLAECERAVEAAEAVWQAHQRLTELLPQAQAAAAEHDAAVRRLLDLREQLLDLRERRIAGMAAELAGALVVGDDCPVCGSADHPRPAAPGSGHPDAEAERAAQRAVDDAQVAEHALDLRSRELDTTVRALREVVGGGEGPGPEVRLAEARASLATLSDRSERHTMLVAQLAATHARASELATTGAEQQVRRAELAARLEHLEAESAQLSATVEDARGDHPELAAAVATLTARHDVVRRALDHASRRDAAADALADAESALGRATLEAGFDDTDAVRAAELPELELAALDLRVREHQSQLTAARAVLDEPDAWELLTSPDPDVAGCEQRHRLATDSLERSRVADEHATRVHERVSLLVDELIGALTEWGPVRQQHALATAVSAFTEGKAPDNRLQMRLSAFVLAFRLSQVVAAANARLAGMSDQRYSLEHVGRRGAGESRGGLSLLVRDDWSGESRDPATLSGGETFVVSLALALGLADVVSSEAGGAELQTLFVDEGFGSLDAETLDDVLDILDTLRENGRAVGVVSHVAEMRDRIPTRLEVGKARSGSTLRVVG